MTEMGLAGAGGGGRAEKYYGKYPGVVRDNKPPAGKAHVGEVLVEVPGILEEAPGGAGERAMQVWARPCFVPGFFFIPEVGAPVWVEFAAGDINQPLWMGVWYPGGGVPQTAAGQAPTEFQKIIHTATGHVIQLDDTSGGEKLVIADKKNGNMITMDATGVKIVCGQNCTLSLDQIRNVISLQVGTTKIELSTGSVKMTDGKGALQLVALEPLISQWLQTHQHTGNMGAPTPVFPADGVKLTTLMPSFKSGT